MTKNEIYEQVVSLTSELAKTSVAPNIIAYAADGDAVTVQAIIDAFPIYYPELYAEIEDFGIKFNKLVGESEEDEAEQEKVYRNCEMLMYDLAQTKIISQMAETSELGDFTKLKEVVDNFKKNDSALVKKLISFQKDFEKYEECNKTGLEGIIFGIKADDKKGMFVFDPNKIDALSFYLLTILANISDSYLFGGDLSGGEVYDYADTAKPFIAELKKAAGGNLADFVLWYDFKEGVEEYTNAGELLVAILNGNF